MSDDRTYEQRIERLERMHIGIISFYRACLRSPRLLKDMPDDAVLHMREAMDKYDSESKP